MLYVPVEDVFALSAFTYFFTQLTELETTQGSETPLKRLAEITLPALSTV